MIFQSRLHVEKEEEEEFIFHKQKYREIHEIMKITS